MSFNNNIDDSALEKGIAAEQHENRTADEWLEVMQAKSRAQGRALSWSQIKRDPELDHYAILASLGQYVVFENLLFTPQAARETQGAQAITGTRESLKPAKVTANQETKQETKNLTKNAVEKSKSSKIQPSAQEPASLELQSPNKRRRGMTREERRNRRIAEAEKMSGILISLRAPRANELYKGFIWEDMGRIAIAGIDEKPRAELELLEVYPKDMEASKILQIFQGYNRDNYIARAVAIYDSRIEVALTRTDQRGNEIVVADRNAVIIFRGRAGVRMRLQVHLLRSYNNSKFETIDCFWDGMYFLPSELYLR